MPKIIIEISKKDKFIIGYGFQADRKLINQSVHNVYLYALISGGILGLVLIIFISIRSAWTSFFLLFNYSILKKKLEPIDLISSFLMLSFLLRGLLETSYGIYSIDYLFFIICYFINEVNYRKFIGAQS
jgi:O-antigen ligase